MLETFTISAPTFTDKDELLPKFTFLLVFENLTVGVLTATIFKNKMFLSELTESDALSSFNGNTHKLEGFPSSSSSLIIEGVNDTLQYLCNSSDVNNNSEFSKEYVFLGSTL